MMSVPPHDLLVRDVQIFDGERRIPSTSVAVSGDRIATVGDSRAVDAAVVVDGQGRTLLPGLIDAHTHLAPGALEQALRFGVTTELDMFASPALVARLKAQTADRADMADVRSAGIGATVPDGHPTQLVAMGLLDPFPTLTSAGEADAWVAARIAEGSDYIKIIIEDGALFGQPMRALDVTTVTAIVAAAHRRGRKAVAHALTAEAARLAVAANVDGLMHVPADRPIDDRGIDDLRRSGAFVCPTLAVIELGARPERAMAAIRDDAVLGSRLDAASRVALDEGSPAMPTMNLDVAKECVARLYRAGVPILAGTDAAGGPRVHGAALHRELELLVESGMGATDALSAATSVPAQAFGLADRGRVQAGLRADLVLVDGDPFTDVRASRSIAGVSRAGVWTPIA